LVYIVAIYVLLIYILLNLKCIIRYYIVPAITAWLNLKSVYKQLSNTKPKGNEFFFVYSTDFPYTRLKLNQELDLTFWIESEIFWDMHRRRGNKTESFNISIYDRLYQTIFNYFSWYKIYVIHVNYTRKYIQISLIMITLLAINGFATYVRRHAGNIPPALFR
jgi:hypothetical protein